MPPLSILIWLPAACGLLGALLPARASAGGGVGAGGSGWSVPGALALLGTLGALGLAIGYIADYYAAGRPAARHRRRLDRRAGDPLQARRSTGLNVFLVGLTTLLFAAAALAANLRSWERPRLFYFQFMLAESAVLGAFLAQDLALFVAFFDLMLIPFYFLIGGWGREPGRVKATIKLVIYTLVGSLLMLAAAIATGVLAAQQGGGHITFVLSSLQALPLSTGSQEWIFLFFAAAFLVKMPAFPLHGWMPDGYRAMPIEVLMVFSGVLSKVGAYGFLRDRAAAVPAGGRALPDADAADRAGLDHLRLGAGLHADRRAPDRRLLLGGAARLHHARDLRAATRRAPRARCCRWSTTGSSSRRCCSSSSLLARRAGGSEDIREMGGIAFRAPVLAALFLIVALATLAMPGSSNFVGEFLILLGVFKAKLVIAIIAFSGRGDGERVRAAAVHPRDAQPRRRRASRSREISLARRRSCSCRWWR